MENFLITVIGNVIAGVILYVIYKWLDKTRKAG